MGVRQYNTYKFNYHNDTYIFYDSQIRGNHMFVVIFCFLLRINFELWYKTYRKLNQVYHTMLCCYENNFVIIL